MEIYRWAQILVRSPKVVGALYLPDHKNDHVLDVSSGRPFRENDIVPLFSITVATIGLLKASAYSLICGLEYARLHKKIRCARVLISTSSRA